ncbi:phage tail sheath subtilisin-like domain-containing protein, partial [Salmonella enterica]|uniref:phage tail sheath subtilisin-like domain-containing protein n=1 Tax=Salmonella enterica TaxID=28901 RepID=UPI00398C5FE4
RDTRNEFGCQARCWLARGVRRQKCVAVKLRAQAEALGAITYMDAPIGTTFQQVLAGSGPQGAINFNNSSDRARLCYPHVKVYDSATNSEGLEPLSTRHVGLRANVDREKGLSSSNSNQEIQGMTAVER